jgi:hypothetical protein
MKLYQLYRKPAGAIPVRRAEGRVIFRQMRADPEGVDLMLAASVPNDLDSASCLVALPLPALRAARAFVFCADDWEALRGTLASVYERVQSDGYRCSGEIRFSPLTITDHEGYRHWEVDVGLICEGSRSELV